MYDYHLFLLSWVPTGHFFVCFATFLKLLMNASRKYLLITPCPPLYPPFRRRQWIKLTSILVRIMPFLINYFYFYLMENMKWALTVFSILVFHLASKLYCICCPKNTGIPIFFALSVQWWIEENGIILVWIKLQSLNCSWRDRSCLKGF